MRNNKVGFESWRFLGTQLGTTFPHIEWSKWTVYDPNAAYPIKLSTLSSEAVTDQQKLGVIIFYIYGWED